jgi:GNAT superfamily N-acetyltransferase
MRGEDFTPSASQPQPLRFPAGRAVTVRRMQLADADDVQSYFRALSLASRHNRFLGALSEVSPAEIDRMCGDDSERQATLLVDMRGEGLRQMIAEARYALAQDGVCEIALSVTDAWQRRGVGTLLLHLLEQRAREFGAHAIVADALRSNDAVKGLTRRCGFSIRPELGDARLMRLVKELAPRAAAA